MKVAAIHFRPDVTQIIEGTIKKNVLQVHHKGTMYPIFPTLLTFNPSAIEEYFQELKEQLRDKNARIYFGLSNDLFKKIDCGEREYVSPDEWDDIVYPWVSQLLQVDMEEYHVIAPLHFENNNKSVITGIAIRSTYIDAIYNAAVATNLNIASIEPSSFAMLRLINKWDEEHCIMEVWERVTSMIGYSPIRGMFKISQSQGWSSFLTMESGSKELIQSISSHDYTAYTTYKIANTDIPIYPISDKRADLSRLLYESNFASRLQKLSLPEEFIQSRLSAEELLEYAVPLGLALAPLHERMIGYEDTKG